MTTAPAVTVLAFDVGSRWLGVAIGNSLTASARSLCCLDRDAADTWTDIDRLLVDWRPDLLVVGEPLTLDGGEQESTHVARRFARQLAARSARPVILVDERRSSLEARERFATARRQGQARRRDAAKIDATAAAIILQRWFDAGMPAPSAPAHGPDHD